MTDPRSATSPARASPGGGAAAGMTDPPVDRQRTRRAILDHLRAHGHGTVSSLATVVDLAPVTVRHHLNVLRERGMVEIATQPIGRGRPRHVYRLSPQGAAALGHGRACATLANHLLDTLKASDRAAGSRFFRQLAVEVARRQRAAYQGRPVEERLDAAVRLLAANGFTARWEADGDDYLVHEVGCAFQALSERHREVCSLDHEILRQVVGGEVRREAWRRDGSAVCTYRIRPPAT